MHWGQRPCQPFNQGSKLYATPFALDELFPFVELFRLEPILSRIKEFPNSVVCPIVDAIDAHTLEYSKNGGYQVGGFSWSLHFTWRDVPSRDLVHRKYTDPVGLVRSWSMCSDFMNLIGKYQQFTYTPSPKYPQITLNQKKKINRKKNHVHAQLQLIKKILYILQLRILQELDFDLIYLFDCY